MYWVRHAKCILFSKSDVAVSERSGREDPLLFLAWHWILKVNVCQQESLELSCSFLPNILPISIEHFFPRFIPDNIKTSYSLLRDRETNIARIGNVFQCRSLMSGHHGLLFSMYFLAVPLRREGQLYRWPRHSLTTPPFWKTLS